MGKVKSITSSRLRQYISEFKTVFTSDHEVLFRQACAKSIVLQTRSEVTQHFNGSEYIAAIIGLKKSIRQETYSWEVLLQVLLQDFPNFPFW
jgi:hypothetical protein